MRPIVVLGAGSWGTALAIQFARGGGPTVLWGREEDDPDELARARDQRALSPRRGIPALARDRARSGEGARAGRGHRAGRALERAARSCSRRSSRCSTPRARIAWASKGFELDYRQAAAPGRARSARPRVPIAVLSGPTFAKEVGMGLPTAIAVASPDEAVRALARRAHFLRRLPRLHAVRHRRRRDRRRGQERARDRDRRAPTASATVRTAACS